MMRTGGPLSDFPLGMSLEIPLGREGLVLLFSAEPQSKSENALLHPRDGRGGTISQWER